MNEISAMPSEIKDWLAGRESLAHIKFYTEFPPVRKAVPLRKITVAVGIGGIEIQDKFGDESLEEGSEYCRNAVINLRFSIHVPYSMGGAACHQTFADIIDNLTFDSALQLTESGCEKIREDRDTEALVLTAFARVKANLCPAASSDIPFPSFMDKTLLCGTHIRDENIHLSERERLMLNEPFVKGTYYGTGASERSFNTGFEPKAVLITPDGMPQFAKNGDVFKLYGAMGIQGAGSLGLELNTKGFRVKNGTSFAFMGAYPALNESGIVYTYIAFR